jgi:hypothetical protein
LLKAFQISPIFLMLCATYGMARRGLQEKAPARVGAGAGSLAVG